MSAVFPALAKQIKPRMDQPANWRKFERDVRMEMDRNSEILTSPGLSRKPICGREPFWTLTGLKPADIKEAMTRTEARFIDKVYLDNPMYLVMLLTIRHFVKDGNKKLANLSIMYSTVVIYTFLHRKYFTIGYGREDVMDYTVNNLSYKFDLKKLGSLMKVLRKLSENNHKNAVKKLLSEDDDAIFDYIEDLRTRLNSFVKTFYNQFDRNFKAGRHLKVDSLTARDEEGEEYHVERTSDSNVIGEAAQSFSLFFAANPLDRESMEIAARLNPGASAQTLRRIMESVKNADAASIDGIVSAMLNLYMTRRRTNSLAGICNRAFVPFIMKSFNVSNVKDKDILLLRNEMNGALERHSRLYANTKRDKTRVAYARGFLTAIAHMLQKSRCG